MKLVHRFVSAVILSLFIIGAAQACIPVPGEKGCNNPCLKLPPDERKICILEE